MVIEQGSNYIELEISSPAPGSRARRTSVGAACGEFRGVRAEVWLEPGELEGFLEDLRGLEKARKGRATLSAEDPRDFQLTIASIDRSGHLEVSWKVAVQNTDASASIDVRFDLDASALPRILRDFELIGAAA